MELNQLVLGEETFVSALNINEAQIANKHLTTSLAPRTLPSFPLLNGKANFPKLSLMHESLGTRQCNSEVIPKHVLTMQYCYKHCILSNLGGGVKSPPYEG